MRRRAWMVAWLLAALACGREGETLVERGARVYASQCVACHHPDPHREGPMGPAIHGSSRELLEARVLRGEYPSGYTPKRDTRLMTPLPFLYDDIDALAAFLNAP